MVDMVKRALVARTVACGMALAAFGATGASATIYDLNRSFGGYSVVGSITTDGAIGVLGQSDISGFDINVSNGTSTFDLNSSRNSAFYFAGDALSAQSDGLHFNYSGSQGSYALFLDLTNGQENYYCLQTTGCYGPLDSPGEGVELNNAYGTVAETGDARIATAPGAPAPQVGVGILSALAAGLALALTRTRPFNPFRAFATA